MLVSVIVLFVRNGCLVSMVLSSWKYCVYCVMFCLMCMVLCCLGGVW